MDESQVEPARRRGLADEVADRVRDAIFSGRYAPGEQLREVELSAALGVSRGPVREALLRLEREGLVDSEWHRKTTVTALSPADIIELDSLRGALEELAVRLVINRASESDLASIEEAAALMEHVGDEHQMVTRDIAFHDAVFAAAHHRRLQEAWNGIRSQVHLFLLTRINRSSEDYLSLIPGEHRELITALRNRDLDLALDLFGKHRHVAFDILTAGPEAY